MMLWQNLKNACLYGLLGACLGGMTLPAIARQPTALPQDRRLQSDRYTVARERMVREDLAESGITDVRVLESMRMTPRHEFVSTAQRPLAYFDMSLPIGERQTISGPFVVAYMTEQLDPKPTDRVLEVGTGSGYQAAVLSPLVGTVYSIEIHESLGRRARATLQRLRYTNVITKIGDGFVGWEEKGPFDKIIVTCSPEKIPLPLIDQLVENGIMIIPVGQRYEQTLVRLQKKAGVLERIDLVPSLFVPMTGHAEDRREVLPDAENPSLANSGFEECLPNSQTPSAWYYGRQETLLENGEAAMGQRHLLLENSESGRPAHIFQGFPIDGRAVRELTISYHVRVPQIGKGRLSESKPGVAIRFFDERRVRSTRLVAPLRTFRSEWQRVTTSILVPIWSREAILQIGLMGATGQIEVDQVEIMAADRS